ncbi:MAG: peptidylprolyl isomerase [Candidatus Diapherotrites archaeon]|uniref:Peptidyl-prolyl cis-trans isomerase n=1 Tax=Candidatus Iainarchaeum sp. TaxID=3101447 RepID=A0A8T4C7M6_9ARCH|nr:peptidylprolyl isomerase [Candidatus Diapherotrites archaeon]
MSKYIGVVLLVFLFFFGCVELPSKENADNSNLLVGTIVTDTIQKGNYVTLYYKGTLDDNSIFDQTQIGSPATFQVGVGGLIEGFDAGLLGMKVGEKKIIVIEPEKAYGVVDAARIITVDKKMLTDANVPVILGIQVNASIGTGKIVEINEETKKVKVDFNDPLAGKRLTFDVEILKISNKP